MKFLRTKSVIAVFATIDLKQTTVTFSDGTGTPVTLGLVLGEGNVTYTEAKTMEYRLNRGNLNTVREGDQVPVDVSFDMEWEYYYGGDHSGATGTPIDFLKKVGPYAANVSSDTDSCNPYSVDLVIVYAPTCSGSGLTYTDETITLADFRYEQLTFDLSAGTISCTGKCNTTAAVGVRST